MSDFWQTLFSSGEGNRNTLELRQIRKGGRPFLLLPKKRGAAATTLDLYPAQTARGRSARSLLRFLIRIGLSIGTERVSLRLSRDDEFLKFLAAQSGSTDELPRLGILAGNPTKNTQRFIIILFDENQCPVRVVKAGLSEPAKALIEKEQQFLSNVPPDTKGIPKLRGTFANDRVKAFAMDYVEGESPRSEDVQQLTIVLSSWISKSQIALGESSAWQELENSSWLLPKYSALRQLRERTIRATVQHGDFAPWNVKTASHGQWTVLDWERGTVNGIPGWDWYHYIIQPAILVEHMSVDEIWQRIEDVLKSDAFRGYSQQTGIGGAERELVIGYLAHLIEVIKPAEGVEANRALLAGLSTRWFNDWSSSSSRPIGRGLSDPP